MEDSVRHVLGTSHLTFEIVKAGFSSAKKYKVLTHNPSQHQYFIKAYPVEDKADCNRECAAYEALVNTSVTPHYYGNGATASESFFILDYMHALTPKAMFMDNPDFLKALGRSLARMAHVRTDHITDIPTVTLFDNVLHLIHTHLKRGIGLPLTAPQTALIQAMAPVFKEETVDLYSDRCIVHNDLNPNNILWPQDHAIDPVFIDFPLATIGAPVENLADVINMFAPTAELQHILVTAYLTHADATTPSPGRVDSVMAVVNLLRPWSHLFHAMTATRMVGATTFTPDPELSKLSFEEFENLLSTRQLALDSTAKAHALTQATINTAFAQLARNAAS